MIGFVAKPANERIFDLHPYRQRQVRSLSDIFPGSLIMVKRGTATDEMNAMDAIKATELMDVIDANLVSQETTFSGRDLVARVTKGKWMIVAIPCDPDGDSYLLQDTKLPDKMGLVYSIYDAEIKAGRVCLLEK